MGAPLAGRPRVVRPKPTRSPMVASPLRPAFPASPYRDAVACERLVLALVCDRAPGGTTCSLIMRDVRPGRASQAEPGERYPPDAPGLCRFGTHFVLSMVDGVSGCHRARNDRLRSPSGLCGVPSEFRHALRGRSVLLPLPGKQSCPSHSAAQLFEGIRWIVTQRGTDRVLHGRR